MKIPKKLKTVAGILVVAAVLVFFLQQAKFFDIAPGGSSPLPGGNQVTLHNARVWFQPPGSRDDVLLLEGEVSYNGVYLGWFYNIAVSNLWQVTNTTFRNGQNGQIGGLPGPPNIGTLSGTNGFSQPQGQTDKFTNLGLMPVFGGQGFTGAFNFDNFDPIPKDPRLRLEADKCDTSDLGNVTLVFQSFNSTPGNQVIRISDFKHTVKRFCFLYPISVKQGNNEVAKITKPYADLILDGQTTQPPGEVWVFQYLAPASEFPLSCPAGQTLLNASCVPADVSFTCAGNLVPNNNGGFDCVFAHQSEPSCESPLVYNWNSKHCEIQTAFCPSGNSFLGPVQPSSPAAPYNTTGYCIDSNGNGNAIDLSSYCSSVYGPNVGYNNGVCSSAYLTVGNNATQSVAQQTPFNWMPVAIGLALVAVIGFAFRKRLGFK